MTFGGNRCRDIETHHFYTDTSTNKHTRMKLELYQIIVITLDVEPLLCTGCTTIFLHFHSTFSKPFLSSVVPYSRGTCVEESHSFFAFLLVREFTPFLFSFFLLDARFDSKREPRSHLVDLSNWSYHIIKPPFR